MKKTIISMIVTVSILSFTTYAAAFPCGGLLDELVAGNCVGITGGDCGGSRDDIFKRVSFGDITSILDQVKAAYGDSFNPNDVVDIVSYGNVTAVLMSSGSAFLMSNAAPFTGDNVRNGVMLTQGGYMVSSSGI